LAAFKKGIFYTGLCFSETHKKLLSEHLESSIWQAMSDDTDPLYKPRLVAAPVDDAGSSQVKPTSRKPKAEAKTKAKGKPANQRPPPDEEPADPIEDEPADAGDDDALSGDA
jgi:hypothetical protein